MTRALAVIGLSLVLAACGQDELAGRLATNIDAGLEAQPDAPAPSVDAGPVIRTVETRNPFGATEEDNLLVDGDFELTAASGQYGWRSIGNAGEVPVMRETGGLCRSGLTCGILDREADLLGFAAAPRDAAVRVEVWTKPPLDDCELTAVSVINCMGIFVVPLGAVGPSSTVPDATGWCKHEAVLEPIDVRPCLFVSSSAEEGQKTLIDRASLGAAPTGSESALGQGPPSPELHRRIARALEAVNRNVPFGRTRSSSP